VLSKKQKLRETHRELKQAMVEGKNEKEFNTVLEKTLKTLETLSKN
jgi:hypothetical protein